MNVREVTQIVGSKFRVQDVRGNIKIDIEDLKGMSFFEKADAFREAFDALEGAGATNLVMQEGYFGRDKSWVSWPSLWVNRESTQTSTADVAAIVAATLQKLGLVRAETAPETPPEPPAEDENPGF